MGNGANAVLRIRLELSWLNGSGIDIDIACDYARPTKGPTRRPYSGEGHSVRALSPWLASVESVHTHNSAGSVGQPRSLAAEGSRSPWLLELLLRETVSPAPLAEAVR